MVAADATPAIITTVTHTTTLLLLHALLLLKHKSQSVEMDLSPEQLHH